MRKIVFLSTAMLMLIVCNAQSKTEVIKGKTLAQNEPRGNWRVSKETDENGNVIRMDSVYTWSSDGKQYAPEQMDSIMNHFRSSFKKNFGTISSDDFFNSFQEDSTKAKSFLNENFFNGKIPSMNEMMKKADSLHKALIQQYLKSKEFKDSLKEEPPKIDHII
ncbi:hypothetical protein ACG2LH_04325 [Zhouia sp. PK063]|uniref:hypothetical protein n=1 Tax=Zhouia sp. PK063 TaxID=3373602 RepID=UPI0037942DFB